MTTLFDENAKQPNTEIKTLVNPESFTNDLQTALDGTKKLYPEIIERVTKAKAALSMFQSIDNDETDAQAERVLVRCRETYELIEVKRKEITAPLDAIKSALMAPGKQISNDAKAVDSEYFRVKKLRDDYANKKYAEAEEKRKEALAQQAREEEYIRLKGAFQDAFFNKVADYVVSIESNIIQFLGKLNLDNFDTEVERVFSMKPALKTDVFASWFVIPYNQNAITAEQFNAFVDNQVRPIFTYEAINGEYVEKANAIIKKHKDSLPSIKAKMIELAELDKTNAEAAELERERLRIENEQKEKELAEDLEKQKQQNSQHTAAAMGQEMVNTAFNTQMMVQDVEDVSGVLHVRTAYLTCEPKDTIKVLMDMLYAIMSNPQYKGIYKMKKGVIQVDENGRKVYSDWLREILDLYTEFNKDPIEGIEIIKAVSTIQKKDRKSK